MSERTGKSVAVIGSGVSGPCRRLAAVAAPRRDALRGRAPARRPQRHLRLGRSRRRLRLHRLQRAHLSQPHRLVRPPRRRDVAQATCRSPSRSTAAGFEYSGGRACAACVAQPANLLRPRYWSMLKDILRFFREAPRGRRPRRSRLARRLSRRAPLRPGVPRGLPLSDGGGDLVDARDAGRRLSRREVHPLQRQSRLARTWRPAGLAHRDRRQPGLCARARRRGVGDIARAPRPA